jgi:hypothetical protein
VIQTSLSAPAQLRITVGTVSKQAELVVRADGVPVLHKPLRPGPGQGDWKQSTYRPQYKDYEAIYDREYAAALPQGTREVQIDVSDGDWLTFSQIRINPFTGAPGNEVVLQPADTRWGVAQGTYVLTPRGELVRADGQLSHSKETLWTQEVEPWKEFAGRGVGVVVGEWGAYKFTPHNVVMAWMKDSLENWERAGIGWALWNLTGTFGPLDSGRSDVVYDDYKGHKLDREMLELLRTH